MLAEQALTDSLAYLEDTLLIIAYHVKATYENEAAKDRHIYYDSMLVEPFVIFNGPYIVIEQTPSKYVEVFRQNYELARTIPVYYDITADNPVIDSNTISFDLSIATTFTIPDSPMMCKIAFLEDSLPGAFNFYFRNVCRSLLQFPLFIAYPDTFDTIITIAYDGIVENKKAVIFIQNDDSLDIVAGARIVFQPDSSIAFRGSKD